MDFNKYIDNAAKKYSYNKDIVSALKRCIPIMAKGKSEEIVQMIINTLDRVQIIDFETQPTQEQIDNIEKNKLQGRNENVKIINPDLGEYGKNVPPGAYCNTPVFDENMNIVDRIRLFIYYKIRFQQYYR